MEAVVVATKTVDTNMVAMAEETTMMGAAEVGEAAATEAVVATIAEEVEAATAEEEEGATAAGAVDAINARN